MFAKCKLFAPQKSQLPFPFRAIIFFAFSPTGLWKRENYIPKKISYFLEKNRTPMGYLDLKKHNTAQHRELGGC